MLQGPIKEDIMQYLNSQQPNQSPEQTLEQLLMNLVLNPMEKSTTRTQVAPNPNNGVVTETKEMTMLNEAGFMENVKQENIYMLDDGTSMNGVARCQTCGGIVKEENLKRCGCGKTCCVRPGCGKFSEKKNEWYCCSSHQFLRFLCIPLR